MNYYRHIDRSKVQFDFLTHGVPDAATQAEVEALGGSITVITPKSTSVWRNLRETRHHLNPSTPHGVVHVHTASPTSFVYLLAAMFAGKRVRVAHSHATDLETTAGSLQHRIHRVLQPVLRWAATDLLACSRAAGDWLFGINARRSVRVLPNAIDVGDFRFSPMARKELRRLLDLEDRMVVGHIGRFAEQKNHQFLIKIFEEVVRLEPAAVLVLVGDGPFMAGVQAQVKAAGMEDSVRFLGLRGDVPGLLQAMDLFLLPSQFEGLPLVLVEAQAAGLPCLASSIVTDEVRLTGLLEFLDLADEPTVWAARAIEMAKTQDRSSDTTQIAAAGYDIRAAAELLADFYRDRALVRPRRTR
jgi:glycosyltransferase involved in cell wall biosynthesis